MSDAAINAQQFVHLRVHSEFSLLDSLVKPKKLAAAVAELGMPAVALTDQCNFFGLIKFYSAARAVGIKPVIGADIRFVAENGSSTSRAQVTLLATNAAGYLRLKQLISQAYIDAQERGYVTRDDIFAQPEGLICLAGGSAGDVGQELSNNGIEQAKLLAHQWQTVFGDRYYLELQRLGRADEEAFIDASLELAAQLQLPVVATNPVCFVEADDFEAHETRVCIQQGKALDDPRRERSYTNGQYLRSATEMSELFADIPSALANSVEIARRCNVEIALGDICLPRYPVPDGKTLEVFLEECVVAGLDRRMQVVRANHNASQAQPWDEDDEQRYAERMRFELDVINQMGFPGYFLIVMEFIQWAKDNSIPVGPGRGSGAGSLVAWALNITDLDPIAGELLFERFLNPERVSMPDFDIDFCMEGRDRVIAHVSETYGKDAVSQIATFGTMAAKAVVRDVARVQGKPYGLADKLSKLIPFEVGMTLSKAVEQSEELRSFINESAEVGEIMTMAYKLEGIVRNVGKHAGGVVIAPTELTEFTPLYVDEASAGLVSQFDKDDVESAGLVKFDFLGLRTLTIIDWAVAAINENRSPELGETLRIEDIPLTDQATFDLLKRAETTAVFQLESRGMKDLIRNLLPDSMSDITALVAIYRPGPMQTGADQDYINRKHGTEPVSYPHDSLADVLKETYGVVLYQEQVMKIAQVLAGFSLGQADLLRRAMGKKKPEEMAKVRKQFLTGSAENQIDALLANEIFDLMEKFAGYAFNKSHSATYALVSYQTAWLKANYPSEFMAATLSADMQQTDKVVTLIDEVRRMDLDFQPPSINQGRYRFVVADGRIIYGLGAIKGVGPAPVEAIVEARSSGGEFVDLNDFCRRVESKKANKRVLEALVKSGAMDCFQRSDESLDAVRARLLNEIGQAVQGADQLARDAAAGITDLFGEVEVLPARESIPAMHKRERLEGERDTLGLYLTGHPIEDYEQELAHFCAQRIHSLQAGRGQRLLAGLIVSLRTMRSKRGGTMAFAVLDDRTGQMEISLFSDVYEKNRHKIEKDRLVVVQADIQTDEYSQQLKARVSDVFTIDEARAKFAQCLEVRLQANGSDAQLAPRLKTVMEPFRSNGPNSTPNSAKVRVRLNYATGSARGCVDLPPDWSLQPSDELLFKLRHEFGGESARYLYES